MDSRTKTCESLLTEKSALLVVKITHCLVCNLPFANSGNKEVCNKCYLQYRYVKKEKFKFICDYCHKECKTKYPWNSKLCRNCYYECQ